VNPGNILAAMNPVEALIKLLRVIFFFIFALVFGNQFSNKGAFSIAIVFKSIRKNDPSSRKASRARSVRGRVFDRILAKGSGGWYIFGSGSFKNSFFLKFGGGE